MDDAPNTAGPVFCKDRLSELEHTCFIIMPFGKKKVGDKEVDFDLIYDEVFKPAVAQVVDADGESAGMRARRTDKDAFSSAITQEMFEYIMYSRLAFGDISGFNANVMYEIGVRHAIQESGTVLFRQTGHDIPFDIKTIKVFEYALNPKNQKTVQQFISGVISETLRRNRLDSPVRLALRAQWGGARPMTTAAAGPNEAQPITRSHDGLDLNSRQVVEDFLRDAQEAIFQGDTEKALMHYWGALRFDPANIVARMRLGLLLKNAGRNYEAMEEFITVSRLRPDYGEAFKEKGVVLSLIARALTKSSKRKLKWLPDGYDALERAIQLMPEDFDAWASLGGQLRNVRGDHEQAASKYQRAVEISNGHPYPLLNALKEQARATGQLPLEAVQAKLETAKALRRAQAQATPPTDAPWCFFDLAEIALYQEDKEAFLENLNQGIDHCLKDQDWQINTFLAPLKEALRDKGIRLPGLDEGIELLERKLKRRAGGR